MKKRDNVHLATNRFRFWQGKKAENAFIAEVGIRGPYLSLTLAKFKQLDYSCSLIHSKVQFVYTPALYIN